MSAGSSSYSTSTASAASWACVALSAITAATWSPTWRTTSRAKTGRSAQFIGRPSSKGTCTTGGIRRPSPAASHSRAVSTRSTPGIARASSVEIPPDAGVPVGAAHEGGVGGAGGEYVVDVAPPAAQEAVILVVAGKGLAYEHETAIDALAKP